MKTLLKLMMRILVMRQPTTKYKLYFNLLFYNKMKILTLVVNA